MTLESFPAQGIQTSRLTLRHASPMHAADLLAFYQNNQAHLKPWDPLRNDDFYTLQNMRHTLEKYEQQIKAGLSLNLLIYTIESPELIGHCNYSNIVQGAFQACHLGYAISAAFEGKGLMYEALTAANHYIFETYGLHRIMANYRPENHRSGTLLNRLGFEKEGLAKSYLKINGTWADHILTSKINPAHL
ncbi:GNAT family N-acetyltransferase [Aquirhabdus parva]|uniref:GNAT family N-acetyltransferase n=1 Tax=Aquirhabdus parva TaxID=2283318 RepID=A0A345P3N0_9GAMM|nr:GNAT family N-acetyltransferase [Aquirhabdus parva]AXI01889.1 GNAT family N-acetyltransferase [Aquirhabdus parva]